MKKTVSVDMVCSNSQMVWTMATTTTKAHSLKIATTESGNNSGLITHMKVSTKLANDMEKRHITPKQEKSLT